LVLGPDHQDDARYLDACRKKRNIVEYDYVGGATESEASELAAYVLELRQKVLDWLTQYHPQLLKA
jgi:hypothetical protein